MKNLFFYFLCLCVVFGLCAQTTTEVENFNSNFGGWQPGTINGFGADKVEFYLSDNAQEGLLSMAEAVSSNSWGAGFQIILADTNGWDWSSYSDLSFWSKGDIASLKDVHIELFSAEDDEQWAYVSNTLLSDTGWTETVMGLQAGNFVEVTGVAGDSALDFTAITKVNVIFLNNGDFNQVLCQFDNLELRGADTVSVENFNANFGGWAPGTINGFGVDKMSFHLTDDAAEGLLALREKVSSNSWGAGFQVIFEDTAGQDWSSDVNFAFQAKADMASIKTVHVELFSAEDDEQWAAASSGLTTDWTQIVVALDTSQLTEVTGASGDKMLDLTHITKMNFIILNNGDFNEVTVTIDDIVRGDIQTAIEEIDHAIVSSFDLHPNYPNPFNPTTKVEFGIIQSGFVQLDVFDVSGKKIKTLVNENLNSGKYEVTWNATNDEGRNVSSGIYIYRLRQAQQVKSRRMVLIR